MPNSDPRANARARALASLKTISDEEDAAITAAAEADPDNPPLTEEDFARMVPSTARRGRGPGKAPAKKLVSLRIDPEVIDRFRADGPGWQARINDILRRAAGL